MRQQQLLMGFSFRLSSRKGRGCRPRLDFFTERSPALEIPGPSSSCGLLVVGKRLIRSVIAKLYAEFL
jgi:hypothetical protein